MNNFLEALLNGWWQGIALTLLAWLVLRDLSRVSAATKVVIWQVTLIVVLLLPALQRIPISVHSRPTLSAGPVARRAAPVEPADITPMPQPAPRAHAIEVSDEHTVDFLMVICIALAVFQLLRLALGYWGIRRLKRSSVGAAIGLPAAYRRGTRVLVSKTIGMPMAVGYWRPAILLPRTLVERLHPEEMRYVMLHEAAHLQRRDDWMALGERAIRAIFCFQPAVHWIVKQIDREREIACDDWVLAQSGETKPYAQALARVAEIGSTGRAPLLATGAGRSKQIFARLETLLDRTRNRVPSVSEPIVIVAGVALILFVFQGTEFNHLLGLSGYSTHWVTSDGTNRREIKIRGDVEFAPGDADVESMSPGAKLVVEESDGWSTRRIEFEPDETGAIQRRYFSGGFSGKARPFDAEARPMLSRWLPQFVREQGNDIPVRLARLIHDSKVDGALADIAKIGSSGVKRAYLEELLRQAEPNSEQVWQVLKIAGQMDSDEDKKQFLDAFEERYGKQGVDPDVFGVIDGMHADDARAEILTRLLARPGEEAPLARWSRSVALLSADDKKADLLEKAAQTSSQKLPETFFEATATIHSDGDQERVLSAVLALRGSQADVVARTLRIAAGMSSDDSKANILVAAAKGFSGGAEELNGTARVLSSTHSDQARRRGMEALIQADGKNPETLGQMLAQTATLNSDEDKRLLLARMAGLVGESEPPRRAFFAALNTIHSAGDQRQVLMAVLARDNLGAGTMSDVIQATAGMSSHDDQAAVLGAIAARR